MSYLDKEQYYNLFDDFIRQFHKQSAKLVDYGYLINCPVCNNIFPGVHINTNHSKQRSTILELVLYCKNCGNSKFPNDEYSDTVKGTVEVFHAYIG